MTSTLFGHLVAQFAAKPENLASEALTYTLTESAVAREAVKDLLAHSGMPVDGDLFYQSQVGGNDQAQPDIVGRDAQGQQRLIIEAKFWANLTDHQPITYLKRLPMDGGTLLFVAPAARDSLLWGELLRRCAEVGMTGTTTELGDGAIRRYTLDDGRQMALVSWRRLLDHIHGHLDVVGERKTMGDVAQLMGLCDHMDRTAFLPLSSDDITSPLFRRVAQYVTLADEAVDAVVSTGDATLETCYRQAVYDGMLLGRYIKLRGVFAFLACDLLRWNTLASTPIWLIIGRNAYPASVREALTPLAAEMPPRFFPDKKDRNLFAIPMYLPLQKTREEVLASLVRQIRDIGGRYGEVVVTNPGATVEPDESVTQG